MSHELYACDDVRAVEQLAAAQLVAKPDRGPSNISYNGPAAIVELRGTTTKYGSWLGPSLINLTEAVQRAASSQNVHLIVLWIDSGGGTVAGTEELARAVADASKSKNVVALVDGYCCSAAYWVGSQAKKVFATNKTDVVGSIGTVMAVIDSSSAANQAGITVHKISTGPNKGVGMPGVPVTADQLGFIDKFVKTTNDQFLQDVASGRKLKMDQVLQLAHGGVFTAAEGVKIGLLDGFSSLDKILNQCLQSLRDLAFANQQYASMVAQYVETGMGSCQSVAFVNSTKPKLFEQVQCFRALPVSQQESLLKELKNGG